MFNGDTKNTINALGSVFRLITPVLLALTLFILTGMKDEIKDIKQTSKDLAVSTLVYNTNHLTHHAAIEKEICERLARIETKVEMLK